MSNDKKDPPSRGMLLRNDVNVDLVLEGKSIRFVIPAALFTVQATGKLVSDNEHIHMIVNYVI